MISFITEINWYENKTVGGAKSVQILDAFLVGAYRFLIKDLKISKIKFSFQLYFTPIIPIRH
ncbi:MAG: hypothetical protein CVU00_03650 [Bacteroidetes bacterium HGW-Bacteroidetes-17]|nr:MAG: hypothetical protein CVU00_03650 [Bacteroidetes bacterium HGW-Bacteroidetes-17]